MIWFRAHIRLGSRLALAALAIQLVLAFAHAHDTPFSGPGAPTSAAKSLAFVSPLLSADRVSANDLADALPVPPHDDGQGDAACAICAVVAMANGLLIPPTPALPPHPPGNGPAMRLDLDATDLAPIRTAFQPRAPPLS